MRPDSPRSGTARARVVPALPAACRPRSQFEIQQGDVLLGGVANCLDERDYRRLHLRPKWNSVWSFRKRQDLSGVRQPAYTKFNPVITAP